MVAHHVPLISAMLLAASSVSAQPVWRDDFDQPEGTGPDPARWAYDLGASGWGNAELQAYTDSRENSFVVEDPAASNGKALVIRARRTAAGGYTSARLKTQGKFSIRHGRIEARLKLPRGQGIWPAFWMLGDSFATAGWPACGEIDIMEVLGHEPHKLYGTLHGPGYSASAGVTGHVVLPPGPSLSDGYHVYAVDWEPGRITWLLDGRPYHTVVAANLPAGGRWVFDDDRFFLLLNLAVGGRWPGYPDETTTFPQELRVDYVRVYPLKPSGD
jgi:beta-glucanase (GH16 family)